MSKDQEQEKKSETPKEPRAPRPSTAKKQELKEASIYIGPSLQGGRLARNTIFKGGELPAHVSELAKEHKAISRLIVPVSKLAAAQRRMGDSSSVEAALFAEARRLFTKGGQ